MKRLAGLVPLTIACLTGCGSTTPSREFAVPHGQYADAFEATKDVLREQEFELARVDAREGVVSTLPRQWAGFMTPWIPQDAEPGAAIDGFLNHERRRARVVFDPPIGEALHDPWVDRRSFDGALTGRVDVTVERIQRPNRRVGVPSVRLSSFARDPEGEALGEPSWFVVDSHSDEYLAGRIAGLIRARMGESTDQTANK